MNERCRGPDLVAHGQRRALNIRPSKPAADRRGPRGAASNASARSSGSGVAATSPGIRGSPPWRYVSPAHRREGIRAKFGPGRSVAEVVLGRAARHRPEPDRKYGICRQPAVPREKSFWARAALLLFDLGRLKHAGTTRPCRPSPSRLAARCRDQACREDPCGSPPSTASRGRRPTPEGCQQGVSGRDKSVRARLRYYRTD